MNRLHKKSYPGLQLFVITFAIYTFLFGFFQINVVGKAPEFRVILLKWLVSLTLGDTLIYVKTLY